MKIFLIIAAICAVSYIYYKRQLRQQNRPTIQPEVLEGELQMQDVVGYLKSLSLQKGIDTPFIADLHNQVIVKMLNLDIDASSARHAVLIGSYKDTPSGGIDHAKVIFCQSLDPKIEESLAGSGLTVLS